MKTNKLKTQPTLLPKPRKDSDKLSPSTASPNSLTNLSSNQFKSAEELWPSNCGLLAFDDLAASVNAIEGSQEEMKVRFDKMVEFL